MNNTTQRIQKVTSKGQMTLPASWRNRVNTDTVVVTTRGDVLEISPVRIEKRNSEYTVFDAIRDNKGKGIKVDDLLKILKKIDEK